MPEDRRKTKIGTKDAKGLRLEEEKEKKEAEDAVREINLQLTVYKCVLGNCADLLKNLLQNRKGDKGF